LFQAHAEEITTIDLQKKKVVSQSAEYILGGHRSDDEE
jgi:hypothetical protein